MEQKSKTLLISHTLPPVNIGVSFLIYRIFKYFDKDKYIVLTTKPKDSSMNSGDRLKCNYYYSSARSIHDGYNRLSSIMEWLDCIKIVLDTIKIYRKENINSILVFPEVGNDILAAYLLHKILKLPLSIYFFDCYSAAQSSLIRKKLAPIIEKYAIRSAKAVFVMSEALNDHYKNMYGVESVVLPHPVDLEKYEEIIVEETIMVSKKEKVVYTGMIYEAHYDAVKNMADSVDEMDDVEFHIYTRRDYDALKKRGIIGKNTVYHGLVSEKDIPRIQKEADVLFLPLAFDSPYPVIIRTASPGKLPEYLAAARPILVHAPKDSYISWYARKNGWGHVVDVLDREKLKEAIKKLIYDKQYCERMIEAAKITAKDHDSRAVFNKMISTLDQARLVTK